MPSLEFTTASLTTATIIKATEVFASDDQMNKIRCIHKMGHFCLIKKEIWVFVTVQIDTAHIVLSEISQAWQVILYNPIPPHRKRD